jgi:hypothetical protein
MLLEIEESYNFEFLLFGIGCHESSHRICWLLNRQLGLSLGFKDVLKIPLKKAVSEHDYYQYTDEELGIVYTLIDNRSENSVLLKEYKQIDFFLKVEDDQQLDAEELRKKISTIPSVQTCFQTEVDGLKSKQHLIFD